MGRNPVTGRQGPGMHAATIPSEKDVKRISVKQIRSGIGHPETMRRTLRAITAPSRATRHRRRLVCSVRPAEGAG